MKNKVLPIIAVSFVIIAILVIVFIPKDNEKKEESKIQSSNISQENTKTSSSKIATLDEAGNVVITTDDVSKDKISFIKYSDESKIELIAIEGSDGRINVALGTCQSCNGSPGAYYTQNGKLLKCNNCGLTFETSVIGVDGNGCHPIIIDEKAITREEGKIKIDKETLLANERLFSKIRSH